mmetsp:Transcript_18766/g.21571  ORF Transcript_18766/g.21571 Transcript_18766/m.21571 type:complete len:118 (-) Transcript_18766:453-806(-)
MQRTELYTDASKDKQLPSYGSKAQHSAQTVTSTNNSSFAENIILTKSSAKRRRVVKVVGLDGKSKFKTRQIEIPTPDLHVNESAELETDDSKPNKSKKPCDYLASDSNKENTSENIL